MSNFVEDKETHQMMKEMGKNTYVNAKKKTEQELKKVGSSGIKFAQSQGEKIDHTLKEVAQSGAEFTRDGQQRAVETAQHTKQTISTAVDNTKKDLVNLAVGGAKVMQETQQQISNTVNNTGENLRKIGSTVTKGVVDTAVSLGADVGKLAGPVLQAVVAATPIIGVLFTAFGAIYEIALVENKNQKKCKRAADRCKGIETIIRICAHEYSNLPRKDAFTSDHIEALERLYKEV